MTWWSLPGPSPRWRPSCSWCRLAGYLAAALVFVPMFLLYTARARPRTAIIYTLVLGIVLLSLPSLLPVDLPPGLFQ